MDNKYKMTISRLTIDKLGVKLYDRVSAVIAEMVANSYDADATKVVVSAPMDEMLAGKSGKEVTDKGYHIEVADDGVGMTPDQVNEFYLKVGAERRLDSRRGNLSPKFKRKVMGRKGVGKLAPFGVCQTIELVTSGGQKVSGKNHAGKKLKGYVTAHLFLSRSDMLSESDEPYFPKIGKLDGTLRPQTGTTIRISQFDHRHVPDIDQFERQLAQRFGMARHDWEIRLVDTLKTDDDPGHSRMVGEYSLISREGTKITFALVQEADEKKGLPDVYKALDSSGVEIPDLKCGFDHDGEFYPVTGWVGYSENPYKDDLMVGVRIYCRGKIAAQTNIFNQTAGFTGEYDIRSYFIGALSADWLDEDEDLIQTDRQNILWSHPLCVDFEKWGQKIVKLVGKTTRGPIKKAAWQTFLEATSFKEKVLDAFPGEQQSDIRETTLEIARLIATNSRTDAMEDETTRSSIVQLSLLFGPHMTLDTRLREAAEAHDQPLSVITELLKKARIAELSSFGKIADDRVKVIQTVESHTNDPETVEAVLQNLIESAPWLIDPQWSPITANKGFSAIKKAFVDYFKKNTGKDLVIAGMNDHGNKRPDFVMSSQDNKLQVIEIKRPQHKLADEEMVRITLYANWLDEFFGDAGNKAFLKQFDTYHITLVCDEMGLTGVYRGSYENLNSKGKLTQISWKSFLFKTKTMHQQFLDEADRQKRIASRA